jgi:hypothetical protein
MDYYRLQTIERALSVVKIARSELDGAETTFVRLTLNPGNVVACPFPGLPLALAHVAELDSY